MKIKLNRNEICLLEQALEYFSRIGTKQYHIALSAAQPFGRKIPQFNYDELERIEMFIRAVEGYIHPDNYSEGIHSRQIDKVYQVAYDIIQVIRYCESWSKIPDGEQPEHFNVRYYKPNKCSGIEFLKCIYLGDDQFEISDLLPEHIKAICNSCALYTHIGTKDYHAVGGAIQKITNDEYKGLDNYSCKLIEDFIRRLEWEGKETNFFYNELQYVKIDDELVDERFRVVKKIHEKILEQQE